jgi:predicted protein tyrosine phosphatase
MTIVVCPLTKATELVALHRPERVISLLNPDSEFPQLGPQYSDRHLKLRFHDINEPWPDCIMPAAEHIREFLQFIESWDQRAPILIHCRAGISRSTAAAYIAACHANPEIDEHEIALALRQASPLARPNGLLVELADAELGRNGRMRDAIATTGRDLEWIEIDENEPFRMSLLRD